MVTMQLMLMNTLTVREFTGLKLGVTWYCTFSEAKKS